MIQGMGKIMLFSLLVITIGCEYEIIDDPVSRGGMRLEA